MTCELAPFASALEASQASENDSALRDTLEHVWSKSQSLENTGSVRVNNDISRRYKLQNDIQAGLRLGRHGDRLLAAVSRYALGDAIPKTPCSPSQDVLRRWNSRLVDANNFGAEVRQDHGAEWAGSQASQLNYADTSEWERHVVGGCMQTATAA
jgi:hypothetical protein